MTTGVWRILRKVSLLIPALCALLCISTGCERRKPAGPPIRRIGDLNRPGIVWGGEAGTNASAAAHRQFPRAQFKPFPAIAELCTALAQGRIDAVVHDRPQLDYAAMNRPEFQVLPGELAPGQVGVGAPFRNRALLDRVNKFIRQYRADGTYASMYARWVMTVNPRMPEIPPPLQPAGTLVVGTESRNEPMNFIGGDGKLSGFDIEFIHRLGRYLNMNCKIRVMPYKELFTAAASGKIDLAVGSLDVSPERLSTMLFSEAYFDSPSAVMALRSRCETPSGADAVNSLEDLSGKIAAVVTGTVFPRTMGSGITGVAYRYYDDNNQAVNALRSGQAQSCLLDEPVARMYAARFPWELRVACVYAQDLYGFAFPKKSPLLPRVNAIIGKMRDSGELEKLAAKWCGSDDSRKNLTDWKKGRKWAGRNGVLRFAVEPVNEPMCYAGYNGAIMGLDVDVMSRIAVDLDMRLEVIPMRFEALLPTVRRGGAEAAGSSLSITQERLRDVDFSDSYYLGGAAILARTARSPDVEPILSVSQLPGKRLGALTGSVSEQLARERFPGSAVTGEKSYEALLSHLSAGKLDAVLMDKPQARIQSRRRAEFSVLDESIAENEYAAMFPSHEKAMCEAFSAQIRLMKHNGTLKKLEDKWFSGDELRRETPLMRIRKFPVVLKYATVPQFEPFAFLRNGQVTGLEIEVMQLAAEKLGVSLETVATDWSDLPGLVSSGRVAFGIGAISVTPERRRKFHFTEPVCRGGVAALVLCPPGSENAGAAYFSGVRHMLWTGFNRAFLQDHRWRWICRGLGVTALLTVSATLLGSLLAAGMCAGLSLQSRWGAGCFRGAVRLIQGIPVLVVLLFLYYVILARFGLAAAAAAILGFALRFAADVGSALRIGFEQVPAGQQEAGRALGLTRFQSFFRIVLPQALGFAWPAYRREIVGLFQMTSIVGYLAVPDLTQVGDLIRSRTFEAFWPLAAVSAVYLILTWLLIWLLKYPERQAARVRRRDRSNREEFQ